MKTAEFSIFNGRIVISMPSEEEIEKLLKSLKELGIEVEEEVRSLCG